MSSPTSSPISSLTHGVGRLLKVIFGTLALMILIVVIGTSVLYHHFSKDLRRLDSINDYKPKLVSEVFADDGTKIGEFWQEKRYLVPYDQIPPLLRNAFVASEDERFWEHRGVDFKSIVRAFVENLRVGRYAQGGSTITQQVARAYSLSSAKKLKRKIQEAILATQIEQNLTKEQILYIYLNQIYLGNRAYGVKAAAENYFHKGLNELNLAEMSLIAGLPSAPDGFNPIKNPNMARQRQVHVLAQMLENKYISHAQYEEALATALTFYEAPIDSDFNYRIAPYFVEYVRQYVWEKYKPDSLKDKDRSNDEVHPLFVGGLKIETTASVLASKAADHAVKRGLLELERRKGFRGPVATVDLEKIPNYAEIVHEELSRFSEPYYFPKVGNEIPFMTPVEDFKIYKAVITEVDAKGVATFKIGRYQGTIAAADRAWTGRTPKPGEVYWVKRKSETNFTIEQEPKLESAIFSYEPLTGDVKAMVGGFSFKRNVLNRVTQTFRQPGSSFKPIIYSAALDKGYSPHSVINDAPVEFTVGRETYRPKNYGGKFSGPMTIRSAITNSVNIVAIKLFHSVGIDYTRAYAHKLGIESDIAPYLSAALGSSEVSLEELARAYGVFPSGGIRPNLTFIRRITDSYGNVWEENKPMEVDPAHVYDGVADNKIVSGYNNQLLNEAQEMAEKREKEKKSKFKLSDEDKKILYGAAIPPGHVITPRTAFLMMSLMKSVVDNGTGFKAKELKRPCAGKTGTTNDESDAWFVAYVPDLVAGVWVGYDTRKKIGPGMTGGVVSAPIWLYYMQEYLKDTPVKNFPVPPNVKLSEVDSLAGGSAPSDAHPSTDDLEPTGPAPASRGMDFLYEDLNKL